MSDGMNLQNSEARKAANQFLRAISGRFPVARAMLFGSYARNSAGPASDVDIAVFLDGPRKAFVPTKLALADIAYEVLLDTGFHIQPLPVWEDEWAHPESYSNPRLLHNIARDGIPL
jgi:predicted nucleotidyltransferase